MWLDVPKELTVRVLGAVHKPGRYNFDDSMTTDSDLTASLQNIRTRLNAFSKQEQGHLINWGYALADTAIRKWANELLKEEFDRKGRWPIPEYKF